MPIEIKHYIFGIPVWTEKIDKGKLRYLGGQSREAVKVGGIEGNILERYAWNLGDDPKNAIFIRSYTRVVITLSEIKRDLGILGHLGYMQQYTWRERR